MSYAAELTAIKRLALHALLGVLQHAKDHAELRRTATAILRIPDPKPEKPTPGEHTPGMRRPGDESRGCATPTRSDATDPDNASDLTDPTPDEPAHESDASALVETRHSHPASSPRPEGLIVSSPAVERGPASDTPGIPPATSSHPDGVLVAPTLATPPPPFAPSG